MWPAFEALLSDLLITRIRWRSLSTRLIVWSFVPTAIVLIAVALVNFYSFQRVTEDLVIGRTRELTVLYARDLAASLKDHSDLLVAVARGADMASEENNTRIAALRQAKNRLTSFDGGAIVLDARGIVVAADPERPEIIGQDWSDRAYYRQIVKTNVSVFSDIVPDGPRSASVVVVGVPILGRQGEFAGVLAGMFRISPTAVNPLYGGIVKLRLGGGEGAMIVDSLGRLIYHSDAARIGEDVSSQQFVQQVMAKQTGDLKTSDQFGQDTLASYSPVPGISWGLVLSEGWSDVTSSSQPYQQFLLVLLAFGVLIPAVVVTMTIRRITGPLSELTEAAKEVAGGSFGRTISTAYSGDEIEDLAKQFNIMSAELQESYGRLEQHVADRTKELATLNAVVAVATQSLDLQEILHATLDKTLEALNMDAGEAYRLGEDQTPMLVAHHGFSDNYTCCAANLPLDGGVAEETVLSAQTVVKLVADYPEGILKTALKDEGLELIVGIPVIAKGRVMGVIDVGTRTPRPITAEELSLLSSIGQQIGAAVENARLYEHAEESAAAAERNRLARDLHDAVSQTLFSASLIAEVLPKIWAKNPDEGKRRLDELRQLTRGALAEMRTLLLELRPAALVDATMADLLRQLGESITGRARVPVQVTVIDECALPIEVKVALYRIAQESLNNVAKHSGASQADVVLHCTDNEVQLTISDNGRGFDRRQVPPDHLGLGIMRERAQTIDAQVDIDSQPGDGTKITITWHRPQGGAGE